MRSLAESRQYRSQHEEFQQNTHHGIYLSPETQAMSVVYNGDPQQAHVDEGIIGAMFEVGEKINWRRYLKGTGTLGNLREQLASQSPQDRLAVAVFMPQLVNQFAELTNATEVFIPRGDVDHRVRLPITSSTISDFLPFSSKNQA